MATLSSRQPEDACPYPRPFPADFGECPAFHGRPYIALDVNYQPLPPVWTCRHLEAQRYEAPPHGFYPRCGLGDAAARTRFVETIGIERLQAIREVEREVIEFELPYLRHIEACKAQELMPAYVGGKREPQAARAEMKEVQNRMLQDLKDFLEERPELLARLGISIESAVAATRAWMEIIVARPSIQLESWELPEDRLDELPDELRGLLSPGSGAEPGGSASGEGS